MLFFYHIKIRKKAQGPCQFVSSRHVRSLLSASDPISASKNDKFMLPLRGRIVSPRREKGEKVQLPTQMFNNQEIDMEQSMLAPKYTCRIVLLNINSVMFHLTI